MVGTITAYSSSVGVPDLGSIAPARTPLHQDGRPGSATGLRQSFQDQAAFSSPVVGKYAEFLGLREASGEAASGIRSNDAVLAQVSDALAKIKDSLTAIVKQYPPYPLFSNERNSHLNDIAGLRKQIEFLTRLPGQSAENGNTAPEVKLPGELPIRLGVALDNVSPDHLGIPLLDTQSSDAEVASALEVIERAKSRINDVRLGMANAVRDATIVSDEMVTELLSVLR